MKTIVVLLGLISFSAAFLPAPAPAAPGETPPWHKWGEPENPASRPIGDYFLVAFTNRQHQAVKIYWLSPEGERKYYYAIPPGGRQPQKVRKGAVWIVTNASDEPIGYFLFERPIAQAIVPHQ